MFRTSVECDAGVAARRFLDYADYGESDSFVFFLLVSPSREFFCHCVNSLRHRSNSLRWAFEQVNDPARLSILVPHTTQPVCRFGDVLGRPNRAWCAMRFLCAQNLIESS